MEEIKPPLIPPKADIRRCSAATTSWRVTDKGHCPKELCCQRRGLLDHTMVQLIFGAVSMKKRKRRSTQVQVSVTAAKGQLTELVRRAQNGEEIVLTRHGNAAARLVPAQGALDTRARRALLQAARKSGSTKATAGSSAARSQDFRGDQRCASLPATTWRSLSLRASRQGLGLRAQTQAS